MVDPGLVRALLDATASVCAALRAAEGAEPTALLDQQRAVLLACGTRLVAAAQAPGEPTADDADGSNKRPRAALALAPRAPRRTARLLNELPFNLVVLTTFFLEVRALGVLDVTCQRFHPVGLTQKACLLRANMWLPPAAWARVGRSAMGWGRWLAKVRYRGRQRQGRGRVAAGGNFNFQGTSWTLAVGDDGTVRSHGAGADGVLGHGDEADQPEPKVIAALSGKKVVQVAAGVYHSLALTEEGEVLSFGFGHYTAASATATSRTTTCPRPWWR